jgi:hypothetical protein
VDHDVQKAPCNEAQQTGDEDGQTPPLGETTPTAAALAIRTILLMLALLVRGATDKGSFPAGYQPFYSGLGRGQAKLDASSCTGARS